MIARIRMRAIVFALLSAYCTAASSTPLWLAGEQPTGQARAALDVLSHADEYGLDARAYTVELTSEELGAVFAARATPALRERFDAALSAALGRFVQDVSRGRVSPTAAGFKLPERARSLDVPAALAKLAVATDMRAAIAEYEPRARPYLRLKRILPQYRELAKDAELTRLPLIQRTVRVGDTYEGMTQLRRLLAALGDLPKGDASESENVFDEGSSAALARFQTRHGLEPDGALGRKTIASLTTPLTQRVRQIELTLERWRWTSRLERPDIVVNIPQFMLFALPRPGEASDNVIEMPVIVGQTYPHTRTPIFSAEMKYVIFQPFWDVPQSIVTRELLKPIRKNPAYLGRQHMEIVRGPGDDAQVVAPTPEAIDALAAGTLRLRQRPGPDNALGQIKFMLPNPYNVYLHSTPNVELFGRSRRAFSHGCIRVSKPADLAEYVLKNAAEPWDAARIETALCDPTTRRVDLVTPLRVMIFYGTAVATDSLGVMFFEDFYGHDAKLAALLDARR